MSTQPPTAPIPDDYGAALSILDAARQGPGLLSLTVYVALAVLALVCGMALVGVYGAGPFLLALGMGVPLGFLGVVLGVSRSLS